jgi:hypothetical protein
VSSIEIQVLDPICCSPKTASNFETNMTCSHNVGRGGERPVSPLIVCDLRAQLVPLNRYGLPGLGAAVAEGLRALIGALRTAVERSSVVMRRTAFT